MKKLLNQRGDASIVVVAIVALVAIGIIGYLAYQNGVTNGKTSVSVLSPSPTTSPVASAAATHTGADALAKMKEFYSAYLKTSETTVAKPYIASEYYAQLFDNQGSDPVLCTQGGSEEPLRYALVSSNATSAHIQIKQLYTGNSQDNVIDVDVRLSDLLVTRITCRT
jgi:hypothetical protein